MTTLPEMDAVDFVKDMAGHLPSGSLAHAICMFMAEHQDGHSLADFVDWADGCTAEQAAARMDLPGADNVHAPDFIADVDMESFEEFGASSYDE